MLSRYPRILAVALILVLAFASPLAAHDPVFLSEEHTSPEVGPLLPDGTISFALYGRLLAADSTQAFQAGFNEGEALDLSLLIPAAFPETSFEVGSLPEIEVKRPDGSTFRLEPAFRQMFHEPYTNTRYLRLADCRTCCLLLTAFSSSSASLPLLLMLLQLLPYGGQTDRPRL